jgi:hypothetical protein
MSRLYTPRLWLPADRREAMRALGVLGAGAAAPFDPAAYGTVGNWYDGSDLGLANAAVVSSWTDKSGNARHATNANAGFQPTYRTGVKNGKGVVRFDGTDILTLATTAINTRTIALVVGSVTAGQHPFAFGTNTTTNARFNAAGASGWAWTRNAALADVVIGGVNVTGWNIVVVRLNSLASMDGWANGGAKVSWDPDDNVNLQTAGRIGGRGALTGPTGAITGDIAEVVIWDAALLDAQVASIIAALDAKWDVF